MFPTHNGDRSKPAASLDKSEFTFVEMLPTLRAATQMSNGWAINPSLRYWYGASIADFLAADSSAVLGLLTSNCAFSLMPTQRDAWLLQLDLLRAHLRGLAGAVFLEFNI